MKRIATVEDDALVAGLKAEWADAKAERKQAERRIAEIEGTERDLREQEEAIETFRTEWKSWGAALVAEPVIARQVLKKILVGPIAVLPKGKGAWEVLGGSRYDAVIHGALTPKADVALGWRPEARGGACRAASLSTRTVSIVQPQAALLAAGESTRAFIARSDRLSRSAATFSMAALTIPSGSS